MRRGIALAALLACTACDTLDPAAAYREAARNLRFSLERVEPRIELAFPLDRSRLRVRLHLGVENASSVRLVARALGGELSLQVGEGRHALGQVSFPTGLDLASHGRSETVAEFTFDYAALRAAWGPLTEAIERHKAATWRLEGEAKLDVLGFHITVPLRAAKQSGARS